MRQRGRLSQSCRRHNTISALSGGPGLAIANHPPASARQRGIGQVATVATPGQAGDADPVYGRALDVIEAQDLAAALLSHRQRLRAQGGMLAPDGVRPAGGGDEAPHAAQRASSSRATSPSSGCPPGTART